ncbi:MAG: hypothetical protein Q8P69_01555 [bacterium]|nr:hypothetical protein [bacterium]
MSPIRISTFFKFTSLVIFFALAGAVFVHSLGSINQDIGRHLKTGEIIWQTKHVPETNLFSYTEPNVPFVNHHWLSEVVFYILNLFIGLKGLIIFKAGILLATFWLLWRSVAKKVEPLPFIIAGSVGLLVMLDRTDVRPEIFSYLFLAYFLFAIFQAKYSQKYTWLYVTPLVQLVWTNMHIYFILGPALLGLFTIDRWINRDPDWPLIAKITGLSLVVTLINPNGIYGALTPFNILNSYGYSIVENQSILFIKNYGILLTRINIFILATILFWLSFIPALKKHGFKNYIFEVGAGLAFTILGFDMIRNLRPYAIVYIPIFALNLQSWLFPTFNNYKIKAGAYVIIIAICLFSLNAVIKNKFYEWAGSGDIFGLEVSAGAEGGVNFVRDNKLAGPVFNNFDVGSYLIWKLYPNQKVFVDGRPEAYSVDFFQKIYIPMQQSPELWQKYSDQYKINYIFFDYHDITPWAQTFLSFISQDKNWPLVYQDNSVVIFLRRTPIK